MEDFRTEMQEEEDVGKERASVPVNISKIERASQQVKETLGFTHYSGN